MQKQEKINGIHDKWPKDIAIGHVTSNVRLFVSKRFVIDETSDDHLRQLKDGHGDLNEFRNSILHCSKCVVGVHHRWKREREKMNKTVLSGQSVNYRGRCNSWRQTIDHWQSNRDNWREEERRGQGKGEELTCTKRKSRQWRDETNGEKSTFVFVKRWKECRSIQELSKCKKWWSYRNNSTQH